MDHVQAHKRLLKKRQFGFGGFGDPGGLFGGDDDDTTTTVISRPTTTVKTTTDRDPATTEIIGIPNATTRSTTTTHTTPTPSITRTSTTSVTPTTTRTTSSRTTSIPSTTSTSSITSTSSTTSTTSSTSSSIPSSTSSSSVPTTSSSTSQVSTSTYTHTPTMHSVAHPPSESVTSSGLDPNATLAVPGNADAQSGGISGGSIAGIVVGVLLGLAVIGLIAGLLIRRHKKKQDEINHFNASNFRRSAFLIDEAGNDDYNPYGAAIAATHANHSGMGGGMAGNGATGGVMAERQYNNLASTPVYPASPYSSRYPAVAHPANAFAPEANAYPYVDPAQQYTSAYYAGGAGVGSANGIPIGGYFPGSEKPLPEMPMSVTSRTPSYAPYYDAPQEASHFDGPFADSHQVSAPYAGAGAVELERGSSIGSNGSPAAPHVPLNVANPDSEASPARKLSVKRVPVPEATEDLMAFPSPPSSGGPATVPLPMSPPPSATAHTHSMAVPAALRPGGEPARIPSPKRETLYDPEDVYGGM